MSEYKAVIIEDEKKSRELLKSLIETFCPEVTISGTADSVVKGISLIKTVQPDIVLLDIEMQSGTGFDLLQQLDQFSFEVIFTTAYEQYALKAIKFSALDYLLKPIDVQDLQQAIRKATEKRSRGPENINLEQLVHNLRHNKAPKISISTSEEILFIEVEQITRCEANGAYTIFYLRNGSKVMASKNLKEFEAMLSDHQFYRVHHSHLINMREVQKYIKADGGMIEMKDGSRVSLSHTRKEEFMELMKA
ncbi:MAG: response regulator transcription factor [Sphingobacteriales bacterium]|nr:MAG: response regulator transcription factor [Sphingobacteriales bacterium]